MTLPAPISNKKKSNCDENPRTNSIFQEIISSVKKIVISPFSLIFSVFNSIYKKIKLLPITSIILPANEDHRIIYIYKLLLFFCGLALITIGIDLLVALPIQALNNSFSIEFIEEQEPTKQEWKRFIQQIGKTPPKCADNGINNCFVITPFLCLCSIPGFVQFIRKNKNKLPDLYEALKILVRAFLDNKEVIGVSFGNYLKRFTQTGAEDMGCPTLLIHIIELQVYGKQPFDLGQIPYITPRTFVTIDIEDRPDITVTDLIKQSVQRTSQSSSFRQFSERGFTVCIPEHFNKEEEPLSKKTFKEEVVFLSKAANEETKQKNPSVAATVTVQKALRSQPELANPDFTLVGFIVHRGEHFLTYMRSNEQWWCVDSSRIQPIKVNETTIDRLLKLPKKRIGNAGRVCLLFYKPESANMMEDEKKEG